MSCAATAAPFRQHHPASPQARSPTNAPASPTKSTLGTAPNALLHSDASLLSLLYDTVGATGGWNTFIDALARSYRGGRGVLLMHDTGIRNGFAQAAG